MFCVYIFSLLLRSDKGKLIIDMNLRYECHNFVMFTNVWYFCVSFLIILPLLILISERQQAHSNNLGHHMHTIHHAEVEIHFVWDKHVLVIPFLLCFQAAMGFCLAGLPCTENFISGRCAYCQSGSWTLVEMCHTQVLCLWWGLKGWI